MVARERRSDEERYIEEAESLTLCRKGVMHCPCFGPSSPGRSVTESTPVPKGTRVGVCLLSRKVQMTGEGMGFSPRKAN